MSRNVFCLKLKKDLPGLDFSPYPGKLGEEIFNNISQQAWQLWLQRQTMFINEYRLNLADEKARKMLEDEMIKFLFEDVDEFPSGYTPD
ncbi:MAG: oxidative damage protection protein [Pseudomonadota bacterium]